MILNTSKNLIHLLYKITIFPNHCTFVFLIPRKVKTKFYKMKLTKEDGKTFLIVLAAGLLALTVHQKFVAPRLAPKPKA